MSKCTPSIGGIHRSLSFSAAGAPALLAIVLVACAGEEKARPPEGGEDSGEVSAAPPPLICNEVSPYAGELAFTDRTEDWGLVGINGGRLSSADLDGDGFPDLIVSEGSFFGRDNFEAGVRYHYVLMNRENPDGGRMFVDETVQSGLFAPREGDPTQVGRASQVNIMGDVDNDGDLDVFSGQFFDGSNRDDDPGDRSELLLNAGDGTFSLAPPSDLSVNGGYATSGGSFADYNADGLLDLFVVGWYEAYGQLYGEQDHSYKGDGTGAFLDTTPTTGLTMTRGRSLQDWVDGEARRPAFGGTTCDLNGDALPDLLVSNYGRAWNQQWMSQGDGTMADIAMESGFASDEVYDYSDNQFYRCYCSVYGCDPDPGAPAFSDETCATYADYWAPGWDDLPHRLAGNSFTTACGDVDNDGDNDVLTSEIVHWHIGGSSDPSELLLNDGEGRFVRPGNAANGLERDWSRSDWNAGDLFTAFFDFDGDGWKDILLVSSDYPGDRMFLFRQIAPGQFEEIADAAGIAHPWPAGATVADFDRDGDLDVITGSSNARSGSPWETHEVHIYENTLPARNSVRIRLEGVAANRAGIGARVELTADDGLSQMAEVNGGYGHMGMQNDTALTFGLGAACAIPEVTVTWPGGAVDLYTDVPANYAVTLVQGGELRVDP